MGDWLKGRDLGQGITLGLILEWHFTPGVLIPVDGVNHDCAILGGRVDELTSGVDRQAADATDADSMGAEGLMALVWVATGLRVSAAHVDHAITTASQPDLALTIGGADSGSQGVGVL